MDVGTFKPWLQSLFNWFFSIQDWKSLESVFARLLFAAIVSGFLVWLVKFCLEWLAKLIEVCQKVGFKVKQTAAEKTELRRRAQFARVLESDLAALAKAENWNDQWFTDLEAEVEIEGRYFQGAWERLLGRPAKGLRRVRSLLEAIESSDEQFLLLVGDPGSGKSVALRHVASALATSAVKRRVPLPLYVNLKELPDASLGNINADYIKQFVIDNVRRGDADTAAYVREHWDDYRDRGLWFFLFDSFDEVPAVLHAATGAAAIEEHAKGLRQFLQGMSTCRGVIASREFKGPQA